MSLLRNVDSAKLVRALQIFGYVTVRQTGGHIRLRSTFSGEEHLITVPNHNPMKSGTLQSILADVARHVGLSKAELIERISL